MLTSIGQAVRSQRGERIHAVAWARAHASWITVSLAMIVAAALRLPELARVPPGLNHDEAVTAYDAYSLFLTGRDHLGHPFPVSLESFGGWSSPLLAYVLAPFVGVFGLHVEVTRAVTALVGVAAIPAVYLLARELFADRRLAAVAACLIAVSPAHVTLSRFAVEPSIVPTVLTLALLLFVRAVRTGSGRWLVLAAAAACATVASYQSMKAYVPIMVVAGALIFFPQLIRMSRDALAAAAAVVVAGMGPIFYVQLRDPAGSARFDQTSVFHAQDAGPLTVLRQYADYFDPRFLWMHGDRAIDHGVPGYGLDLKVFAPFVLLGVLWMLWQLRPAAGRWRRQACGFVLVAFVAYPVPGSVTIPSPHTLRAIHVLPLLAIAGAAGLVVAAEALRSLLRSAPRAAAPAGLAAGALVVVALAGWETGLHERAYFGSYRAQAAPAYQYGLAGALAYARAHSAEYDEIWITDVAEPYIYVLFYNAWPPEDVHDHLAVHRAPPASNLVTEFHQYRFESLPPDADPASLPLIETIREPGGGVAYRIRGGRATDGKRLLLISKR